MSSRYMSPEQLEECLALANAGAAVPTAYLRLALEELCEFRKNRDYADARMLARLGIPVPGRRS